MAADSIPAVARLVALCDTLDAMTSDRPYRSGYSFSVAAAEIRQMSGTQFDPAIVEAFVRATPEIEALVSGMDTAEVPQKFVAAG